MSKYIERGERLFLALNAGARAIENNKRLAGTTYVVDVFSENPKGISYCEAAKLLREVSQTTHADVAPVRHGRWIRLDASKGVENFKCSDCQSACCVPTCMDKPMSCYCPNCGAKMGGGDDDAAD